MLYALFQWLEECCDMPGAGLFKYITFRAGVAIMLSLLISMVFGGRIVRYLRRLQIGESVRDLGLAGQKEKEGTPTMGGVIIILAILIPCVLMANLKNVYVWLMLLATAWMGTIGFIDDYIKVFRKNKEGLSGKFKILGQVGLGLIVALTMLLNEGVVVRMNADEAEKLGYTIVHRDTIAVDSVTQVVMANVQTTMTNIPFVKGNNFDYRSLLWFLGANADKWVWIIFVPLIISSGGNSGSQASTLVIRAMALGEVRGRDWWRVVRREILTGLALGGILGVIGLIRIVLWQAAAGSYGDHYLLIGLVVGFSLIGVVMFGTLAGSMLPFLLRKLGADPASASAPFVATLVDVTGLVIYFTVAHLLLSGSML